MEVVNTDERQEKDWKVFDEFSEIFGYLLKSFFDGITQVPVLSGLNSEWRGRGEQKRQIKYYFFYSVCLLSKYLYIPSNENVKMKEYIQ